MMTIGEVLDIIREIESMEQELDEIAVAESRGKHFSQRRKDELEKFIDQLRWKVVCLD